MEELYVSSATLVQKLGPDLRVEHRQIHWFSQKYPLTTTPNKSMHKNNPF